MFFIEEKTFSKELLMKMFPYNEQKIEKEILKKKNKPKNKGGRPPADPMLIQKAKNGLATGEYKTKTEAAQKVGISRCTLYKYL